VDAQDRGRDLLHDVWGEAEALRLKGGIPDGLGAEGVEMRGEMAVHAVRLDQCHRRRNGAEQLVCRRLGCRSGGGGFRRGRRRCRMAVPDRLEQSREPGVRGNHVALAAFEEAAPLARDGVRILEVVLEQRACESRVEPVDVRHCFCCSSGTPLAGPTRADCS
jgi:hypothetical protein